MGGWSGGRFPGAQRWVLRMDAPAAVDESQRLRDRFYVPVELEGCAAGPVDERGRGVDDSRGAERHEEVALVQGLLGGLLAAHRGGQVSGSQQPVEIR